MIGLLCSLLAAALSVSGNFVEKRAVGSMAEINLRNVKKALRTLLWSRLWIFGVALSVGAAAVQAIAFSRAPIAVVQTAFGAGLVVLVVASHLHWGEQFRRNEGIGLGVALAALVCVGISLDARSHVGNASSQSLVLLMSGVTVGFVGAVTILPGRLGRGHGLEFGIASGLLYGVSGVATKGIATILARRGVAHSIGPVLSSVYLYIFVVAAAVALVTFQVGIQRGRLGIIAPISNVVAGVYVVVVGMLAFDEKLPSNTMSLVLRVVGIAGMLVGTALVATGEPGEEAL